MSAMPATSSQAIGKTIGSANIGAPGSGPSSTDNSARSLAIGFKIGFPVENMPVTAWRSAPSIWRAIRTGMIDENICGVSFVGIHGRWFVASAVLRDAATLAGIEGLPWDYGG